MKIEEARAIVGKMVLWLMIANGVEPKQRPGKITEDLQTLLRANRMVEAAKKRASKRIDKIVAEKGAWKGRRSMPMTIADRGIAALYVAANFPGDNPKTANVLAMHGDNIVFCLDKNTLGGEDEE